MRPAGCCRRLASNLVHHLLFWTPLLEGEGRRVSNDPGPGCVPGCPALHRAGELRREKKRAPRAVCLLRAGLKSVNQGDDPQEEPGSSLRVQASSRCGTTPVWG